MSKLCVEVNYGAAASLIKKLKVDIARVHMDVIQLDKDMEKTNRWLCKLSDLLDEAAVNDRNRITVD